MLNLNLLSFNYPLQSDLGASGVRLAGCLLCAGIWCGFLGQVSTFNKESSLCLSLQLMTAEMKTAVMIYGCWINICNTMIWSIGRGVVEDLWGLAQVLDNYWLFCRIFSVWKKLRVSCWGEYRALVRRIWFRFEILAKISVMDFESRRNLDPWSRPWGMQFLRMILRLRACQELAHDLHTSAVVFWMVWVADTLVRSSWYPRRLATEEIQSPALVPWVLSHFKS